MLLVGIGRMRHGRLARARRGARGKGGNGARGRGGKGGKDGGWKRERGGEVRDKGGRVGGGQGAKGNNTPMLQHAALASTRTVTHTPAITSDCQRPNLHAVLIPPHSLQYVFVQLWVGR